MSRAVRLTFSSQRVFIGLANATDSPQPGKGVAPRIRAVLRWAEELKRLAPSK
jgi:hypothetical protein